MVRRGLPSFDDVTDVEKNVFSGCCCMMTSVVLFVSCFLLGFSFDTLTPDRMAFLYNRNTHQLRTDRLYGAEENGGGRFFVGLGKAFDYPFPRTAQRLTLSHEDGSDTTSISARLSDGIPVEMALSLQYRLRRNEASMEKTLLNYGSEPTEEDLGNPDYFMTSWEPFFLRYIRSRTRDVLSLYNVYDMWESRPEIAVALKTALSETLDTHETDVLNVQLLELTIPAAVQQAIENTTVQGQRIEETRVRIEAAVVAKELAVGRAELETDALVIRANSSATQVRLFAESNATTIRALAEADSKALQSYATNLNLTAAQLIQLNWIDAVSTSRAGGGVRLGVGNAA